MCVAAGQCWSVVQRYLARAIIAKVAAQLDVASHARLLHVVSLDRCFVTIYRETRGLS